MLMHYEKEFNIYINKNLESGQKFSNNTKDYRLQYKSFTKIQYFCRG